MSESEHVPFPNTFLPWPAEPFHSLTDARTHAPFSNFSTSTRCCPPSCAAWTAATSSCRTGGSRVLLRPSQHPATLPVTVCSTTASTTRPDRPSKTRRAAASASPSSKRPRCATPPPGVPTPDSPASPATPTTASPQRLSPCLAHRLTHRLDHATARPSPALPRAPPPPAPRPAPRPRSRASPTSPGRCGRAWARGCGAFVAHASRHYKARWLRAFAPASGVLRCVGALDGAPCAHGARARHVLPTLNTLRGNLLPMGQVRQ